MAVTVKQIIPPKAAEAAQTTQYTAAGCKTMIDKFTVTNYNAENVAFSLNLVPNGGSAGNTNLVIDAKNIVPGETYLCPEVIGHVMEPGGFISTLAGAATSLAIVASGREIT